MLTELTAVIYRNNKDLDEVEIHCQGCYLKKDSLNSVDDENTKEVRIKTKSIWSQPMKLGLTEI